MQEEKTKTKYNDSELGDFRALITDKIIAARSELYDLASMLSATNSNGDDTATAGKTVEMALLL